MYKINQAGWGQLMVHQPSPNFNARPADSEISLLVIHNISLPPGDFTTDDVIDFFQNRLQTDRHPFYQSLIQVTVSAHFFIRRDGQIIQFVSTLDRAWHAGKSAFEGVENCNDYSIGIELEGTDDIPFEASQYQSLVSLTQVIQYRHPAITNQRITGHANIAPGRKTDPGQAFDWSRYLSALIKS